MTVAEFALQTRPRPGRFTLLSPLLVPPQPNRFFNYPRALPQGDRCAWPALASRAIGRKSYLEIHDCAQMLDDVLVINSHHIDRVLKFSMGAHEAIPFENGAAPVELYVFKVRVAIKMRVKLLLVE